MSVYEVAEYLGYKNMVGDDIDDILSHWGKDIGEKKRLYNYIAYGAAIHGHRDIVMTMIERGANDWNLDSICCIHGYCRHTDIVKYINEIRGQ